MTWNEIFDEPETYNGIPSLGIHFAYISCCYVCKTSGNITAFAGTIWERHELQQSIANKQQQIVRFVSQILLTRH